MNTAWFAKLANDELIETLYFGGFSFTRERVIERGVKVYKFNAPEFKMIISGRKIKINNTTFNRVSDAKYYIQKTYM
jgi:hypothetical protein